jgi:hypothetical protein
MTWLPAIRWAHGLVAAFVGGGAGAVTATFSAAMIAPDRFNTHDQLRSLVTLMVTTFAVNGALSVFFYLKTAPLPEWDGVERRGDL